MRFPTIDEILRWFGIKAKSSPMVCPNPNHEESKPSFFISSDRKTCFCFGCGIKNGWDLLVQLAGSANEASSYLSKFCKNFKLPKIQHKIFDEAEIDKCCARLLDNNFYYEQLIDRGISKESIINYKIGLTDHNYAAMSKRIIIPVMHEGFLVNINGRALTDQQQPKYKKLSSLESCSIPFGFNNIKSGIEIYFTEGEFDAISLLENNIPACACGLNPSPIFFEYLKSIPNLKINICFDNDKAGKEGAVNILRGLLKFTTNIQILSIINSEYKDVNEILIKEGKISKDDFAASEWWRNADSNMIKTIVLYHSSSIARRFAKLADLPYFEPTDREYAIEFLKEHTVNYSPINPNYHDFYIQRAGLWSNISDEEFCKELQEKYPGLGTWSIQNVSKYVKNHVATQEKFDCYDNALNIIPFANCAVDIDTGEIIPYTDVKNVNICNTLQTKYNPDADCPRFKEFLFSVADENPQRFLDIECLLAQILTRNRFCQRFHIIFGEADNGKSVLIQTLQSVIGKAFSTDFIFSQFKSLFGTSDFVNKILASCSEASADEIEQSEILKQIVSRDNFRYEMKFKTSSSAKGFATVIFSINTIPKFRNLHAAIIKRLNVIAFKRVFSLPGDESYKNAKRKGIKIFPPDFKLQDKLGEELEGIAAYLVKLSIKHIKHGFPKSADTPYYEAEIKSASSSIFEWWACGGESEFKNVIFTTKQLYDSYRSWAESVEAYKYSAARIKQMLENMGFIFRSATNSKLYTTNSHNQDQEESNSSGLQEKIQREFFDPDAFI
jgi:phage/plasmid-associated DNA primase